MIRPEFTTEDTESTEKSKKRAFGY